MTTAVQAWNRLASKPLGKRLFSIAVGRRAPYFSTLRARFVAVRPHYAALVLPKHRRVLNHLGTVHAIALCNGLEAAAAMVAEATVPAGKRWIPVGIEVSYKAKADSDVTCTARTEPSLWSGVAEDVPVSVQGTRADGMTVIAGTIMLRVTDKPAPAREPVRGLGRFDNVTTD